MDLKSLVPECCVRIEVKLGARTEWQVRIYWPDSAADSSLEEWLRGLEMTFSYESPHPAKQYPALPSTQDWNTSQPDLEEHARFGLLLQQAMEAAMQQHHAHAFTRLIADAYAGRVRLSFSIELFGKGTTKIEAHHGYPWELLKWNRLSILRDHPVLHWISPALQHGKEDLSGERAALVITAGTPSERAADLQDHQVQVVRALNTQGYGAALVSDPQPNTVLDFLKQRRYDILYIVCHGEPRNDAGGALLLGGGERLTGEALIDALNKYHRAAPLSLVILCACYSAHAFEGSPTFALAPMLVSQGVARRVLGFVAPVERAFAMGLGLDLLRQKPVSPSWEAAYFRARSKQKGNPSWPLARMFVAQNIPAQYGSRAENVAHSLLPPRPPPIDVAEQPELLERSLHMRGLTAWLRRPEDPNLVFITGPPGIGKTALALKLSKQWQDLHENRRRSKSRQPALALHVELPEELVWVEAHELPRREDGSIPEESLYNTLRSPVGMSSDKPGTEKEGQAVQEKEEPDVPLELLATSCLLILDAWPQHTSFPLLRLGPRWKILVTSRELPPKMSCEHLELRLGSLSNEGSNGRFRNASSNPLGVTSEHLSTLFTDLPTELGGNPLVIEMAACAWSRLLERGRAEGEAKIPLLLAALKRRRSERGKIATLLKHAYSEMPKEAKGCFDLLVEQLKCEQKSSWYISELAAKKLKGSGDQLYHERWEEAHRQLEALHRWGVLRCDISTQHYSLHPAVAEALTVLK